MVHLTRKEHFNAAHRLYVDAWSKAKNQEIFGKCANEHYHGHNFEVFVTVKGEPDRSRLSCSDARLSKSGATSTNA